TLLQDTNSRIRQEGELLEELIPSTYEWKVIKELIQLLEPFEQVTRLFSGQNYSTLNIIYPCMVSLRNSLLERFDHFVTSEAIEVKNEINEDLASRWDYPNNIEIYASFFDLRFKDLEFLTQELKIQVIEEIKQEYETETTYYTETVNQTLNKS
ncbi:383_t:CDS:2, partial [Scutellospora calospora]